MISDVSPLFHLFHKKIVMNKYSKIMLAVWCVLALICFISAFFAPLYFKIIGIAFGVLHGFVEFVPYRLGQSFHVSNDMEAHVVLHEDFVFQRREHQPHECGHLVGRSVPVFGREGIKREKLHAESGTL